MHQSTLRANANLNEKFDSVKNTTVTKKDNQDITYIGPEAPGLKSGLFNSNTYFSAARPWHFELLEDYQNVVF